MPKKLVDMDAWNDAARVDLWKEVDPVHLFRMGQEFIRVASQQLSEHEISDLKKGD